MIVTVFRCFRALWFPVPMLTNCLIAFGLSGMQFGPEPGSLSYKYGKLHNVLRASSERLCIDAADAPLPEYPKSALRAGKQGLVEIEVVISPAGRVTESLIHKTFDKDASDAVTVALKSWRFHTIQEMSEAYKVTTVCGDCIRIGRFDFEFRIENGKGRVIDLAAERLKRSQYQNPYLKKKQ